jgi:hypothetical protein
MTAAVVVLVLVAGVAASWWYENRSVQAPPPAAGAYRVRVTQDGRELASFDVASLKAIGMKKVVVQGGAEEGPAVLSVLSRAGVSDFTSITVIGMAVRDGGRLELKKAEIGPDTVLDIAKRGTVKIAGPDIAKDKRVRDVTEIQVN